MNTPPRQTSQALLEGLVPLEETMRTFVDPAYDFSLLRSSTATPQEKPEEGYFGYSVQVLEALGNDSDVGVFDMKMGGIGGVDGAG